MFSAAVAIFEGLVIQIAILIPTKTIYFMWKLRKIGVDDQIFIHIEDDMEGDLMNLRALEWLNMSIMSIFLDLTGWPACEQKVRSNGFKITGVATILDLIHS